MFSVAEFRMLSVALSPAPLPPCPTTNAPPPRRFHTPDCMRLTVPVPMTWSAPPELRVPVIFNVAPPLKEFVFPSATVVLPRIVHVPLLNPSPGSSNAASPRV